MAKPINVSDSDFEQNVIQSDIPVVVDFWAPWCGPCRTIAPILEELAGEYEGRLKIAKVNVDDNGQWASKFRIQGIPTLIVFKHGEAVQTLVGSRPKGDYKRVFDQVLG